MQGTIDSTFIAFTSSLFPKRSLIPEGQLTSLVVASVCPPQAQCLGTISLATLHRSVSDLGTQTTAPWPRCFTGAGLVAASLEY